MRADSCLSAVKRSKQSKRNSVLQFSLSGMELISSDISERGGLRLPQSNAMAI